MGLSWMRRGQKFFTMIFLGMIGTLFWGSGSKAFRNSHPQWIESGSGIKRVFLYEAKKLGVPILKASIGIENGSFGNGRLLYQVQATVVSLHSFRLLMEMNNRFLSILEADTCLPLQYVKEIDQKGFLIRKKNYFQTINFDFINKKIEVEKKGSNEKQEYFLSPGTYDPLSMFAKCYLKDEIIPGQDIRMSIFDGIKLRQMVFYTKSEKMKSKRWGEVETICLESNTSFSTFEEREGKIRIWYTTYREKIPMAIELDLPLGNLLFELEEIKGG